MSRVFVSVRNSKRTDRSSGYLFKEANGAGWFLSWEYSIALKVILYDSWCQIPGPIASTDFWHGDPGFDLLRGVSRCVKGSSRAVFALGHGGNHGRRAHSSYLWCLPQMTGLCCRSLDTQIAWGRLVWRGYSYSMSESDVPMPMDVVHWNKVKVMNMAFPTYHNISIDSPVYLNVLDRVGHKTSKSTSARGYVPLLFVWE